MKFGIVGNNDGPLYLLNALHNTPFHPEFVGLQKPVSKSLKTEFKTVIGSSDFFEGFNEDELLRRLKNHTIGLLINCFCNFRFDELLGQPFNVLNVHLSPLPKYRGRHPLQWALINGEKEFGITIHKITEKFDAGEIYWQKKMPVDEGMSVAELRHKLMKALQAEFGKFLTNYKNSTLRTIPNKDSEAIYIPRRYPADSKLTEWDDAEKIYRKVMALRSEDNPAYIEADGHKIECLKASVGKRNPKNIDEPFINTIEPNRIEVSCLGGRTIWLHYSPENRKFLRPQMKIN